MKAYKLVRKHKGKLFGFNAHFQQDFYNPVDFDYSLFAIEYSTEITSVPKLPGSKLFAFDSIRSAQAFFSIYDEDPTYELWEAEVEPANITLAKISTHQSKIAEFWNPDTLWGNDVFALRNTPIGTIFCESIKLTRRITGVELSESAFIIRNP